MEKMIISIAILSVFIVLYLFNLQNNNEKIMIESNNTLEEMMYYMFPS